MLSPVSAWMGGCLGISGAVHFLANPQLPRVVSRANPLDGPGRGPSLGSETHAEFILFYWHNCILMLSYITHPGSNLVPDIQCKRKTQLRIQWEHRLLICAGRHIPGSLFWYSITSFCQCEDWANGLVQIAGVLSALPVKNLEENTL